MFQEVRFPNLIGRPGQQASCPSRAFLGPSRLPAVCSVRQSQPLFPGGLLPLLGHLWAVGALPSDVSTACRLAISGTSPPTCNLQSVETVCRPACCVVSDHRPHGQVAMPGAAHLDPQRAPRTPASSGASVVPGPARGSYCHCKTPSVVAARELQRRGLLLTGPRGPHGQVLQVRSLLVGLKHHHRKVTRGPTRSVSMSARAANRKGTSQAGAGVALSHHRAGRCLSERPEAGRPPA